MNEAEEQRSQKILICPICQDPIVSYLDCAGDEDGITYHASCLAAGYDDEGMI